MRTHDRQPTPRRALQLLLAVALATGLVACAEGTDGEPDATGTTDAEPAAGAEDEAADDADIDDDAPAEQADAEPAEDEQAPVDESPAAGDVEPTAQTEPFDCSDGDQTLDLDGDEVRTFLCGTATATVTYDGITEELTGGHCADWPGYGVEFGILNVDRDLSGSANGLQDFLGLIVDGAEGDGIFEDASITVSRNGVVLDGTGENQTGTATVEADMTRGSFDIGPISGTWDCVGVPAQG